MYAIFIFDTFPRVGVGEPIPDRVASFYCRTFGFVPTLADAAEKLTLWISREPRESMYTKRISVDSFIHVKPGIYIRHIDWNHKVIMLVDDTQMSVIEEWPEEIFNMELEL